MKVLIAIMVLSITMGVWTHPVKDVNDNRRESISAYAKQSSSVPIPFKKCFKVETDLETNRQFIDFKPTRLYPNSLKKFSLKNEGSKISVLEELLSPIVYKHSNLLVFDDFLMVFLAPKTVIIGE